MPPPAPVPASRDNASFDGGNIQGRGGVLDWINVGYVTRNHSRSISRSVEYAQNDFAISQVAKGLGKMEEFALYRNRSKQWENLWNANFSSDLPAPLENFKGFLCPRNEDGSWNLTGVTGVAVYNATDCGECEWNSDTYEGLPYEYSFAVPHDVARLVELVSRTTMNLLDLFNKLLSMQMGGPDTFIRRLNTMYIPGLSEGGGIANTAGVCLCLTLRTPR